MIDFSEEFNGVKFFFINTSTFSVMTNNVLIIIVAKLRRQFFFQILSNSDIKFFRVMDYLVHT